MYTLPTKKLLMLNILDILHKYTDVDNTLTQKEIEDILLREYSMKADRKSIKRNLMNLREFGYNVKCEEIERRVYANDIDKDKDGKVKSIIYTDFYLDRDFTDGELCFLIDSIISAKGITLRHRSDLIDKLKKQSSVHFIKENTSIKEISNIVEPNKKFFTDVEKLNKAISEGYKVSFNYCEYGVDKKLHEICNVDGSTKVVIAYPYQMEIKDGKYYLLAISEDSNLVEYRIDRIKKLEILEKLSKKSPKSLSVEEVHAKLRISQNMIGDVIDTFGEKVRVIEKTDSQIIVSIHVNELAIIRYAKIFAPNVVVLGPDKLVKKVKTELKAALEIYRN